VVALYVYRIEQKDNVTLYHIIFWKNAVNGNRFNRFRKCIFQGCAYLLAEKIRLHKKEK